MSPIKFLSTLSVFILGSASFSHATIVSEWDADDFTNGATWPGTVAATVNQGSPAAGVDVGSIPGNMISFVKFSGAEVFEIAALNNPLVGRQEFSVSIAFRTTSAGLNGEDDFWRNVGMVGIELPGAGVGDWGIGIASGGTINGGTGLPLVDVGSRGPAANNGAWRVVTLVVDQIDAATFDQRLYLDGTEVAFNLGLIYGGATTIANSQFYFGRHNLNDAGVPYFKGDIAHIRLDDVALTPAEITATHAVYLGTLTPLPDSDNDDLTDAYELSWPAITSLNQLDGKATGPGPGSGTGDFDGDGLLDIDERGEFTDPTNADTDGDNLNDGNEVHVHLTNPLLVDTDGDNIRDGDEIAGTRGVATNPLLVDSDADGFDDDEEFDANTIPNDVTSFPNTLVAHWHSDDVADGAVATWIDRIAGIAATGLGTNLPNKESVGILFDGIDASFEVAAGGNPLGGRTKFTITSVFKISQGVSVRDANNMGEWWANSFLVGRELPGGGRGDFGLGINNENELLGGWGNPDGGILNDGVSLNDGAVHVASATFKVGGGIALYLDGNLINTSPNDGSAIEQESLNFGVNILGVVGDTAYFSGHIQQILLHEASLGLLPIAALHAGLAPTGVDFRITSIGFDPNAGAGGNGQFTLEWNSDSNANYAIERSPDLNGFGTNVVPSVNSQGTTTTATFDHPEPGAAQMYFRVRKL